MCGIATEGPQRPIVTAILGQSGPMHNNVKTQDLRHFGAQGPRLVHFLRGRPGGSAKPKKSCRDHFIFLQLPQQCNQRSQCFLIGSGDESDRRISQAPEAGLSGGHGQVCAVRRRPRPARSRCLPAAARGIYIYICAYICMHACMYVCMYIYIHT